MKYNREQLVDMLVKDEMDWLFGDEVELVKDEYKMGLKKLGIEGADKFEMSGIDHGYGYAIYDFGIKHKIAVDGQGCFRRLFFV